MVLFLAMGLVGFSLNAQEPYLGPPLNELFETLQNADEYETARRVEQQIWDFWTKDSDNARARELMFLGIISMEQNELDSALLMFEGVVEHDPDWAEGWNKRATIHFLLQNFDASISDVRETLAREPRHFGAFSGLGMIYTALGQEDDAIVALQRGLKIHPFMKDSLSLLKLLKARKKERGESDQLL